MNSVWIYIQPDEYIGNEDHNQGEVYISDQEVSNAELEIEIEEEESPDDSVKGPNDENREE